MIRLIETVRIRGGRAPLWPLHRDRLARASAALRLEIVEVEAPAGGLDRIVRIEAGEEGTTATARALTVPGSIALALASVPHPGYPWKTTDRAVLDRAGSDAAARGADDALFLGPGGSVAEASRWSVIWREPDGSIGAPPLTLGILDSVARRRLGEMVEGKIREREIPLPELRRMPVAVLNAARGIVPVRTIGDVGMPAWPGLGGFAARFWP